MQMRLTIRLLFWWMAQALLMPSLVHGFTITLPIRLRVFGSQAQSSDSSSHSPFILSTTRRQVSSAPTSSSLSSTIDIPPSDAASKKGNKKRRTRFRLLSETSTSSIHTTTTPPVTTTTASIQQQHNNNPIALQQRQKSLANGHHPLVSLNLNLDSLAKSGAAHRAQQLLHRIEVLHHEGYYQVAPDVVSYNSVLNAWAQAISIAHSMDRALELFERQLEQTVQQPAQSTNANNSTTFSGSGSTTSIRPTLVTYNTLILAFSKRGQAENAMHVLRFLQSHQDDDQNDHSAGSSTRGIIGPDTISFNSVLHAWAVRGNGVEAEKLLKEMMKQRAEAVVAENRETTEHSGRTSSTTTVVKADTISFNTVLHAYRNDPIRAQALLEHMEHLYRAGNDDVEPDVFSYTSVIQSWANSKTREASTRAKQLLETMEKLHGKGGREKVAPNTVTYSSVLKALAKSRKPGSADEAYQVLERMMHVSESSSTGSSNDNASNYNESSSSGNRVKPDVVAFSTVIDAYAKDKALSPHGAKRALELLEQMKQSDDESLQPNEQTYTSVLCALAKRGDVATAQALLNEMVESPRLTPSTIHYNAVLDAHAKSRHWNKAERALAFLLDMEEDEDVKTDIISFNCVLAACANTRFASSKKTGMSKQRDCQWRALTVCVNLFKQKIVLEEATPITYFLLFKAIRALLPPTDKRRWSLVQQGFSLCCQAGLLNERVLRLVKRACSTNEQYASLLAGASTNSNRSNSSSGVVVKSNGGGDSNSDSKQSTRTLQYSDLPSEWKCHTHQR